MGEVKGRDSGCDSQKESWVGKVHQYVCLHIFASQECIQHVSDSDAHNAHHGYPVLDGYQTSIVGRVCISNVYATDIVCRTEEKLQ